MSHTDTASPGALYARLIQVVPNLRTLQGSAKSEARGFMDLHLDLLRRTGTTCRIALAHYYRQNGDSVPDPDMEVVVDFAAETANAATYQDSRSYREADPNDRSPSAQRERRDLNEFLALWLSNLVDQGHLIAGEGVPQ